MPLVSYKLLIVRAEWFIPSDKESYRKISGKHKVEHIRQYFEMYTIESSYCGAPLLSSIAGAGRTRAHEVFVFANHSLFSIMNFFQVKPVPFILKLLCVKQDKHCYCISRYSSFCFLMEHPAGSLAVPFIRGLGLLFLSVCLLENKRNKCQVLMDQLSNQL